MSKYFKNYCCQGKRRKTRSEENVDESVERGFEPPDESQYRDRPFYYTVGGEYCIIFTMELINCCRYRSW